LTGGYSHITIKTAVAKGTEGAIQKVIVGILAGVFCWDSLIAKKATGRQLLLSILVYKEGRLLC